VRGIESQAEAWPSFELFTDASCQTQPYESNLVAYNLTLRWSAKAHVGIRGYPVDLKVH
jgi:hypothetical protein